MDPVKSLVGGTCTLFQRLDENGSMVKVVTNVVKKDGKRAGPGRPAKDLP